MLWNRIRGLWNAYHGILAIVMTILLWIYFLLIYHLIAPGAVTNVFAGAWESVWRPLSVSDGAGGVFQYLWHAVTNLWNACRTLWGGFGTLLIYSIAGITGIVIAAIRRRSKAPILLTGGLRYRHRLAFYPTAYVGIMLLIVIVVRIDPNLFQTRHFALLFLLGFLIVLYGAFFLCNIFIPRWLAHKLFFEQDGEHVQRTLLVGERQRAEELDKWMRDNETTEFGLVRKSRKGDDENIHVERIGDIEKLKGIIEREKVRQILLLDIPKDEIELDQVIEAAEAAGVRLLIYDDKRDLFRHKICTFTLHGRDFISLRNEPLEDPFNRIIKRMFDVLISAPIVLFILPPLMLIVFIMQKRQSPGPLFYRQKRGGFADIPFEIYKFRTMRVNRPEDEKAQFGEGAAKQATAGDVRIFPFGRLLRKTSLDEVPQFINVFKGDMSVVGPRPHMVVHNEEFRRIMSEYHVRTLAKPGITGLAQAAGFRGEAKGEKEIRPRVEKDIEYIESWSVALDFTIIGKTALRVLVPHKTAY